MTPAARPSARTVVLSETIDPDGALWRWMSPDLEALGWRVVRFPTQELVHLLSPSVAGDLFVRVVTEVHAHLAIVHPPIDVLSDAHCAQVRASGCRLVGIGMDDPLYPAAFDDAPAFGERYDARFTFSPHGPAAQRGALPLRWAISPDSVQLSNPTTSIPTHDLILVGRARPTRVALVERLREERVDIGAYGAGWPAGALPRQTMLAALAFAGAVLTPNDGEEMVKARLLEAAWLNPHQLVQRSRDLAAYLRTDHPDIWETPEDLMERLQKPRTPMLELREHRWSQRFHEVTAPLELAPPHQHAAQSPSLALALSAAAHHAEAVGRLTSADALFEAWLTHQPASEAYAGRMRLAHRHGDYDQAATWAESALRSVHTSHLAQRAGGFLAAGGQGTGLGLTGALAPEIEWHAIRLHSLLHGSAPDEAVAAVRRLSDRVRREVAKLLDDETPPIRPEFWAALRRP